MESTDVLVIGSGIAGLCAAIEAARAGATVTIASAGKTMSGSSFFPGTWGMGLIGPVDEGDEQDLIDTIQAVGGGVADPTLVQTFVHGIPQAIQWLEQDLGVELQRPQSAECLFVASCPRSLVCPKAFGIVVFLLPRPWGYRNTIHLTVGQCSDCCYCLGYISFALRRQRRHRCFVACLPLHSQPVFSFPRPPFSSTPLLPCL